MYVAAKKTVDLSDVREFALKFLEGIVDVHCLESGTISTLTVVVPPDRLLSIGQSAGDLHSRLLSTELFLKSGYYMADRGQCRNVLNQGPCVVRERQRVTCSNSVIQSFCQVIDLPHDDF